MAFAPVFGRPFAPTFDRHAAAVAAAGWWVVAGKTCVVAYQPKGAASLAASYSNLANPGTYDAALGIAPTWGSGDGWIFDGVSQYLNTGYAMDQYATLIVRYSNAAIVDGCLAGSMLTSRVRRIRASFSGNLRLYYGNDSSQLTTQVLSGVVAMASNNAYVNGSSIGTISGTWTGTNTEACGIGARSNGTTPHACKVQALTIYSATLTAGEVATVSAAMAAL